MKWIMDILNKMKESHWFYAEREREAWQKQFTYYLCPFSIAALTNYHLGSKKLSGLEQICVILQFCRLEVQCKSQWTKIKVSPGLNSFRRCSGRILFQIPEANHIPWLVASFHCLQRPQYLTLLPSSPLWLFYLALPLLRILVSTLDPPRWYIISVF